MTSWAPSCPLPVLAKLPLDPALARAMDEGKVEDYAPNPMAQVAALLEEKTGV